MVSNSAPQSFQLVNLATNPPTTVGVYANISSCRAAASSLTNWEIFYTVPKQQRPGAGGIQTGGSPNVTYKKRLERHGGAARSPTYGIDDPGSAGGQTRESGNFGI